MDGIILRLFTVFWTKQKTKTEVAAKDSSC